MDPSSTEAALVPIAPHAIPHPSTSLTSGPSLLQDHLQPHHCQGYSSKRWWRPLSLSNSSGDCIGVWWRDSSYAWTVYKVERPRFLDSALALATSSRANHQLASLLNDTFAKLVETGLTGEQIFERYRLTLKDRDALAGVTP